MSLEFLILYIFGATKLIIGNFSANISSSNSLDVGANNVKMDIFP